MPRIPWGTPTLSDSDKLEWATRDYIGAEELIARLKFQLVESDDFADLSAWDETDSGGKVNLAAGVVSLDGNDNWGANGIARSVGVARAQGYFEWKERGDALDGSSLVGIDAANALITSADVRAYRATASNLSLSGYYTGATVSSYADFAFDAATWYTLRIYILNDYNGNPRKVELTVQGGAYPAETSLGVLFGAADIPATLYWLIQRRTSNAAKKVEIKEWRWYSGYDTGGEYMEFVADAGAGQVFDGLDWSNVDLPSGLAGTNLKYKTSYDDDPASYDGSWLTKAQLNDKGAVAGNKRYIRLRVQINSDGDTQEYGAAVNADDGISGVFAQPSAAIILTGNTVNAVVGTFDEAARNTITANKVEDGHEYLHLGEAATGSLATGAHPDPVTSLSATAGNGQATLTIVTPNPTDVVYARYRKGGDGWSDESESLKRTGSGDITVPSLTNEAGYEFIVYVKSAGVTSDWSDPAFATPTAGSTPSGHLSLPLKYLRDTVAASSTFQGGVGAANAEEAAEKVYYVAVSGPEADFAVVDWEANYARRAEAGGSRNWFEGEGDLVLVLRAAVSSEDDAGTAAIKFQNWVGGVLADMEELAGTAGYLDIRAFELMDQPARPETDEKQAKKNAGGALVGDFYQVAYRVVFGSI